MSQYATKQVKEQPFHDPSLKAMAAVFIMQEIERGSDAEEIVRVLTLYVTNLRKRGVMLPDVDLTRVNKDYVYEVISVVTGLGIKELRAKANAPRIVTLTIEKD